jgi:hypothetical protein
MIQQIILKGEGLWAINANKTVVFVGVFVIVEIVLSRV